MKHQFACAYLWQRSHNTARFDTESTRTPSITSFSPAKCCTLYFIVVDAGGLAMMDGSIQHKEKVIDNEII